MLLCQMVVCSSLLSFSQTSKEWAITVSLSNIVALRRVLGVSLLAVSVLAAKTKMARSLFPQGQRRFVHKDLAEADAKHRTGANRATEIADDDWRDCLLPTQTGISVSRAV